MKNQEISQASFRTRPGAGYFAILGIFAFLSARVNVFLSIPFLALIVLLALGFGVTSVHVDRIVQRRMSRWQMHDVVILLDDVSEVYKLYGFPLFPKVVVKSGQKVVDFGMLWWTNQSRVKSYARELLGEFGPDQ